MKTIGAVVVGLAVSSAAVCGGGCNTWMPETRVVTDLHYGPNGLVFIEQCALRRGWGRSLDFSDCDVTIRTSSSSRPDRRVMSRLASPRATPEPAPPSPGTLGIISFPPGAMIELDGTAAGSAPFIRRQMAPGAHLVKAVWPDGTVTALNQTVDAGKSTTARLFRP